jgi:hypothetical protein
MSLFSNLTDKYEEIWKSFIRPPRHQYSQADLGPSEYQLCDDETYCTSESFKIPHKNYSLVGNLWTPSRQQQNSTSDLDGFTNNPSNQPQTRPQKSKSVVLYLHSMSGCQLEGKFLVDYLLPHNISVCTLDFGGAGNSTGILLTLKKNRRIHNPGLE